MSVYLQAEGLGWAAGGEYILLDLELEVTSGQWLAISGANGAGKTTLLALLCGRRSPSRGVVRLHGSPLPELAPHEIGQRIAVLEHRPGLYLDLTGRENLTLMAALAGVTDARISALLEQVGLPESAWDRRVRTYSRGMRQRAALARVLASQADVWLLDEPSTGLDGAGRAVLVELIRQATARGTAVITVSHDQEIIAQADHHLTLERGRLTDAQGAS